MYKVHSHHPATFALIRAQVAVSLGRERKGQQRTGQERDEGMNLPLFAAVRCLRIQIFAGPRRGLSSLSLSRGEEGGRRGRERRGEEGTGQARREKKEREEADRKRREEKKRMLGALLNASPDGAKVGATVDPEPQLLKFAMKLKWQP